MNSLVVDVMALFGFMAQVMPLHAKDVALGTPPVAVSKMSQDELNAFGVPLPNEAYAIMSEVGSPKGQIGGSPNQVKKNAVRNAKALFDDAALIRNARLHYGITK